MKLALLIAIFIGMAGADAQTVRVRNQPVDLSPVILWLKTKTGDRPMPHWKALQIRAVVRESWGGHQVAASIEGEDRQILIQNLPKKLIEAFERDRSTMATLANIEQRMEQIERQNEEIDRNMELTVRDLSNAYEINKAQRMVNDNTLRDLQLAHDRVVQNLYITAALKDSNVLAHFTGRKIGGGPKTPELEVWDCGVGANLLQLNTPLHLDAPPTEAPVQAAGGEPGGTQTERSAKKD
jgi:hypothetical protein